MKKLFIIFLLLICFINYQEILYAMAKHVPLEKYEPENGCYLGASLDWGLIGESKHSKYTNNIDKFDAAIKDFNKQMNKKHAIFCCFIFFPHGAEWEEKKYYNQYPTWDKDPCGWAAPKDYIKACERNNAGCVLTIEPWVVKDFYTDWQKGNPAYDATVQLAKGCSNVKTPIFIRFAHEMNGCWYPWSPWIDKNQNVVFDKGEETGVTPEKYVIAYQNFVKLVKKYADNVAFIWCPNQGWLGLDKGVDLFCDFYPGDEYVDWMGIDFYERGWAVEEPGSKKLWGGIFGLGLQNDMKDKDNTKEDESVNFYKTYCENKNKPLMICETGASLTFRGDWKEQERRDFSHSWKIGYWNNGEQGWLYNVYGTSYYEDKIIAAKIDKDFPLLKGILWFQQGKAEDVVVGEGVSTFMKSKKRFHVFYSGWCDFRIGYNSISPDDRDNKKSFFPDEIKTYFSLINNPYFLSDVVK